ncbi:CDC27 protein [Coemansia sp. RSA 2337]|nr:CDC27 protein [Coemansia sp. S3946]KAJ2038486.1 CDC27 protein [Coemansia sp. S16]KAJ2055634.1 CDC27 protein [Coemansia sp. S155-1]KAJ2340276.1 CDC27 protein [Coemansia sp. RSA 2673]KAJ2463499.1 CDC27 protein [Coemansia sp. RSA 2337]
MSNADDILRLWVLQEEQVVTYRKLSRELKVHVNIAKQVMLDFYEANKSSCHATFLVTGTKKPSVDFNCGSSELTELSMKLVPVTELASAQQGLDNAASHIYSIEHHATNGKHVLAMANISAGPIRDMAELSAVGSSVTRVSVSSVSRAPAVQPETPRAAKIEKAVSSPAASVDSSADKQDQQAEAPSAKPPVKAKDAKSFFGKQISKSAHADKPSGSSAARAAGAPVKVEPKIAVESQTDSDVDMDNVEGVQPASKRRVEDMFDDDDFDGFDDVVSAPESRANQETQGTVTTASREASDVEMSDSESRDVKASSQDMQVVDSQPGDGHRVRKRRKVSKVKHTKNKRGMLVTQAVEEWESYSESEPEPVSRAAPVKRQSAGDSDTKKAPGKSKSAVPQRSILTFFGKK